MKKSREYYSDCFLRVSQFEVSLKPLLDCFLQVFSLGMGHYILNASHSAIICMTCSLSNVPFATRFL